MVRGRWRTASGCIVAAAGALAAQQPPDADAAVRAQLGQFFAADAERRAAFEFDRGFDEELRSAPGDARLRALVFAAWRDSELPALREDHEQRLVRAGDKQSAFTVKQVGEKPAGGWALVIAMHGGGGAPQAVNDGQWRHMQVYYKDHPEASGYLYCALRAPTDEWNGFYTDYFYPLLEKLIRQFVVCDGVDPDRVVAIGYSHGGYGAFAVGPKLPHRFAAVHASASAPTDGETSPVGLHTLPFSFMVGGKDTAFGRRERCEKFAARLAELKQRHPGRYPSTFTLVEKNGHTGLPDRDLLADLVTRVRTPLPRALSWEPTDTVVTDHYWLRLRLPQKRQRLEAKLDGQRLTLQAWDEAALAERDRVTLDPDPAAQAEDQERRAAALARVEVTGVEAWLDARVCDLSQPLELVLATVVGRENATGQAGRPEEVGLRVETRRRTVQPAPSLRTLCATMAQRGDPQLAASWIVELR
jgi:pimeloyl-ACP methyl ester carboxylesterase